MSDSPDEITRWLDDARRGDRAATDRLMTALYGELRRIAGSYFRHERPNHTLQPTAVVHEAFFRLVNQRDVDWQNRAHFLGIAARAMRRVLLDHARSRAAEKHAGGLARVTLGEEIAGARPPDVEVIALDAALQKLEAMDPRLARVVELKYFGGLTNPEIADLLGVSVATVDRERATAVAWLRREIGGPRA